MERKRYPYGVSDFKALVTRGYCFVDKTGLICDLCGMKGRTLLFTRPRRFGKSINLSMIDRFFNIEYAGDEDIFRGLAVSECDRCTPYRNAYPVVKLNFGDLSSESAELFRQSLALMIAGAAKEVMEGADPTAFDECEARFLERCLSSSLDEAERQGAIRTLCGIMKRIHHKGTIILVDEYDHCMQDIRSQDGLESVIGLLAPFMEQTFKFNPDYEFAVITGIMPLAKTRLLGSFNDAKVCSILETEEDESFGFTEKEIVHLIEETGNPPEKLSEIREWYDGYRFGDADVYNPHSIMRYLGSGCEPVAYWNNMTGGSMSEELVSSMSAESLFLLLGLYESEGSFFETVLDTGVTYPDVLSPVAKPSAVCSYLAMAGYLKAVRTGSEEDGIPVCRVSIANREVSTAFKKLMSRAKEIEMEVVYVMDSICRKDASDLEESLASMLIGPCQDADWSKQNKYRDIIMAYLMTPGLSTHAEMPKGYGNTGIFFEGHDGHLPIIIEVKTTNDPDMDLGSLAQKALAQIDRKRYSKDPDSEGAICVGLGIRQKSVKVAFAGDRPHKC